MITLEKIFYTRLLVITLAVARKLSPKRAYNWLGTALVLLLRLKIGTILH